VLVFDLSTQLLVSVPFVKTDPMQVLLYWEEPHKVMQSAKLENGDCSSRLFPVIVVLQ